MTYRVQPVEGTDELVEVYDDGESVAGPFTYDEAAAWVEAATRPADEATAPADEPEGFDPAGFEPEGIL